MIADGRILIKQGVTVDHITQTGVRFSDGSSLEVDCIIYAYDQIRVLLPSLELTSTLNHHRTGWGPVRDPLVRLFGAEAMNRCSETWGTDKEGELRGVYRPSGHPAVGALLIDTFSPKLKFVFFSFGSLRGILRHVEHTQSSWYVISILDIPRVPSFDEQLSSYS